MLREFSDQNSEYVLKFVLGMLVNEFKITLEYFNLDSGLLDMKNHYNKNDGGYFWIDDSGIILK
jgi:hypothetical protein